MVGESTETAAKRLNFDDKQFVNHAAPGLSQATEFAVAVISSGSDGIQDSIDNHPGHRRPWQPTQPSDRNTW